MSWELAPLAALVIAPMLVMRGFYQARDPRDFRQPPPPRPKERWR